MNVNIHRKYEDQALQKEHDHNQTISIIYSEHHLLCLLCNFLLDLRSITMRELSSQCINTPSTLVSQKL